MKHSLGHSSISSITKCCSIIVVLFISACSSHSQAISITGQPVFSENDTFVNPKGNTGFDRNDYFLVKGNLPDKEKLKKMISDFADKYPEEKKMHYNNYLMFFYKNSAKVNEDVIKKEEEKYRYKIFTYSKDDDYIGCITYRRDSTKSFVNWNSKYE